MVWLITLLNNTDDCGTTEQKTNVTRALGIPVAVPTRALGRHLKADSLTLFCRILTESLSWERGSPECRSVQPDEEPTPA